jgi:NitT/TauT family transport system ATP-binding protein
MERVMTDLSHVSAMVHRSSERQATKPVAVAVRDLSVTFAGQRPEEEISVLKGINLEIRQGEFACFVGPSGCGKTTLLNVIGGFQKPTQGDVLVDGEPVRGQDPRRIFIFQEGGVFPWLTVWDNVGFGLSRKIAVERYRIIRHYVDMVGLNGFESAYPHELSGGMRQRVEIARALAANPEIIYMDEPFGALDYFTRLKMRSDLLRIWQHEQKTVLFVTHDVDEALQLADRVFVLSRRPAVMDLIETVSLARPRDPDSPDYLNLRSRILSTLGLNIHHTTKS